VDDTGFVWTWKILQERLLMPSTITLLFQARSLSTSWVWELIPVSILYKAPNFCYQLVWRSVLIYLFIYFFISFAKETKTFNATKLKKGVGKDTATAEANYSGPIVLLQKKKWWFRSTIQFWADPLNGYII